MLASILLALGCGGSNSPTESVPQDAVRVEALNAVYRRGSAVILDLVNDTTVTVGSNGCARGLERLVGGDAWGRLPTYDTGCFAVYIVVLPGRRGRLTALLPTTLAPGTYRTYHELGIGNTRVLYVRYSGPFEVR